MRRQLGSISKLGCLMLFFLGPTVLAPSPPSTPGLTLPEFDQVLAGFDKKSDRASARQIAGLRLNERVSSAKLSEWEAKFRGDRTRKALMAIADATAFLPSPAAEVSSTAPPDPP